MIIFANMINDLTSLLDQTRQLQAKQEADIENQLKNIDEKTANVIREKYNTLKTNASQGKLNYTELLNFVNNACGITN